MIRYLKRLLERVPAVKPVMHGYQPRAHVPVPVLPPVAVKYPPPASPFSARRIPALPPAARSNYADVRKSKYAAATSAPAPRRFEREGETELYLPAAAPLAAAAYASWPSPPPAPAPIESGGGGDFGGGGAEASW